MRILLMGPQGAGKGTVATLLTAHFSVPHISMGDLLRETLATNSPLAQEIKSYMDKGILVPLDVIQKMLNDRLEMQDCKKGFILDGFPRDKEQADVLDKIVSIDYVIVLNVSREVSLSRLGNRLQCKNCGTIYNIVTMPPIKNNICDKCSGELYQRSDDKAEAIEKRLEIYETETAPLIQRYNDKVVVFDTSDKKPQEVFDMIVQKIQS